MREGGDRPVLQGTHARVQVSQQQVSEPPQDVRLGCLVLPALPVATGAAVPTAPIQEWVACPVGSHQNSCSWVYGKWGW